MLVETKARVGVFAIALGAYLPQFPTLVPEFEGQYAAFKKTLPDTVEVIDGGIVTTKEQSMAAGDKFRAADVDLVILQLLTYATSYNMLPAVRDLDVPVVLVNVQKKKAPDYANTDTPTWLGELYACGAVGEMVADLERAGKRHAVITGVVEGGDPAVQAEINDWCKAAQVRRRFRDTNLAQIGRPYPGMMDLYIDETNLYNRMWLYTKQFDWEKMWAIADNITDEDAIRELSALKGIGVWTAEMILLFCMQRPNIFSYDDLAIQRGLRMVYHHRKIDRKLLEKYHRRFSPYCSVASLYLWEVSGGAIPGMRDYALVNK